VHSNRSRIIYQLFNTHVHTHDIRSKTLKNEREKAKNLEQAPTDTGARLHVEHPFLPFPSDETAGGL